MIVATRQTSESNAVEMDQSESSGPDVKQLVDRVGAAARAAARDLAAADTNAKNAALISISTAIRENEALLLERNAIDLEAAREKKISDALYDRLELNSQRIASMADGLSQIATLPDPVGTITDSKFQPSGLQIGKMSVPLGVIGIIYESRPNVTADAAALCIKAGNAAVLRGGSEAIESNRAIARLIAEGLEVSGLPATSVQLIDTTDRAAVGHLIQATESIDVIIPRGGKSLVARIASDARVPVIKHLEGICHVYIDDMADLSMALEVAVNSKTYRYGICGAMETLLVARSRAREFLPQLQEALKKHEVEIRGCETTGTILEGISAATEEDWHAEYLAPILSVKVVDDMGQAIEHIEHYGSSHTDAIVTSSLERSRDFVRQVDSSSVMVNAATCFADGFQYGLGAEIGISTDKLHVRGPVGLEGLTTQKYVVIGDGTIRR